jgi:hypothetical protein
MQLFKTTVSTFLNLKIKPTQHDSCLSYIMTGAQLLSLEPRYEHPTFQCNINPKTVEAMVIDYKNHSQFFYIKNRIIFSVLAYTNKVQLMDGQHRIEMIKKLGDELNTHHSFEVIFYNIKNDADHLLLFNELNYDSHKNKAFVSQGVSSANLIYHVGEQLKEKYHFSTKREYNETDRLYTIKAFMDKIMPYLLTFSDAKDVMVDIDSKLSLFKNKIQFECYKEEQVCYPDSMMAITRVNFPEFLLHGSAPNVIPMNKRTSMNANLKKQVWEKEYGIAEIGKCPISTCTTVLSKVGDSGWHGGHILSRFNGGKTVLDNLRPICATCNSRMREMNWV